MSSVIFSALFLAFNTLSIGAELPKEITLFGISNVVNDGPSSTSIVGAQWIAVEEINNNTNLLPNYKLNFKVFGDSTNRQEVLKTALNVTTYKTSNINEAYFPIILGTPWSSFSTVIAPILNTFNMGQLSSSATSAVLSDDGKYPYFYRTVPSDTLQAEGIMLLCNTFNWTNIAVVYEKGQYGLYLSLELQELATYYNIDLTTVSIYYNEEKTFKYAAETIHESEIYIIIVVIHDNYLIHLFEAFDAEGILGYPYYYLGTDAWFDQSLINKHNLSVPMHGFIGTVPWQTNSLPIDEYSDDIKDVVNKSMNYQTKLLAKWRYYYNNDYSDNLYVEEPGSYMTYGYDAVYVLAHAMQEIEDNQELYGGDVWNLTQNEDIMDILKDIIVNKTNFTGATGHILFDKIGDRINGLYSLGNILSNGDVDYFGYFYKNIEGNITSKINISKIVWPTYFTDKGIIPQSGILIHEQLSIIPTFVTNIILVICSLSILIALVCMVLSVYYYNNVIIRAVSWRLNIIICIGAILWYIRAMIYGIDEILLMNNPNKQQILDSVCNLRTWITTISYTLLVMPLFAKTYRLSQIFNGVLYKKNISDNKLFILIAICVSVDIVLLITATLIHPLKRVYLMGDIEIIDEIRQTQYIYGSCSDVTDVYWYSYGVITAWKIIESLWGISITYTVSKLRSVSDQLIKFDETGIQIFSIFFVFIIILISIPIYILCTDILVWRLLIVITIILIGNVIVSINICPRIYAVIIGNEEKYQRSPAEQMKDNIKEHLKKLGWNRRDSFMSIPFKNESKNECTLRTEVENNSDDNNNVLIV